MNSLAFRSVLARRWAGRVRSAEACPSLRYGFPVLLGFGSHRVTHSTHCVRCVRTDAVSQMTKRAGTRADPKPAVLGGAYAQRPRCTHRLAGGGCSSSSWRRNAGSTGPRALRRPCDFWYSSMSGGAAPSSGQAQPLRDGLTASHAATHEAHCLERRLVEACPACALAELRAAAWWNSDHAGHRAFDQPATRRVRQR